MVQYQPQFVFKASLYLNEFQRQCYNEIAFAKKKQKRKRKKRKKERKHNSIKTVKP